ncbi:MAG: hypothetical protein OEQ47_14185 [Acidimicrobiia bacterium]|nr:hypothetical protein [Acidimicrobiia bacterium]
MTSQLLSERRATNPAVGVLVVLSMLLALVATAPSTATADDSSIGVIVVETNPISDLAEAIVTSAGGVITSNLDLIGGFAATMSWSGTSWSGTSWSGTSWSSAGWDAASGLRWD